MASCMGCKHFKFWPATYWEPSDADCKMLDKMPEELEDVIEDIFCNGSSFDPADEEHSCPYFECEPNSEDDYWDKYAWEENHYDKDERM